MTTSLDVNRDHPSGACAAVMPNLFDAHVFPNLILPLVLGNLLSRSLWDFSARIQSRLKEPPLRDTEGFDDKQSIPPLLRAIQHQINSHFEHLSFRQVGETYGMLDLDEERRRLGSARVDAVVRLLLNRSRSYATMHTDAAKTIAEELSRNCFPVYCYTNFDVVRANRRLARRKSRAPMGLTSCLDEVAIFAALAMTLPKEPVETVIVLANPTHYTAFGWGSDGAPWWFYGKNALYSMSDWRKRVSERPDKDAQAAFDEVLGGLDRLIAVSGTFDFTSGVSSVPEEHLAQFVSMIDKFFGLRLRQLDAALRGPRTQFPESPLAPVFRELLGVGSIDSAQDRLLNSADESLQMVQYSYRSLSVTDPAPYLQAARNSPWAKRVAASLTSADEAITYVANIPGSQSIFQDRNRIAMPEETLRLQTGSDRDKALLLHVLLENIPEAAGEAAKVATVFTAEDSFVIRPDFCFNVTTLAPVSSPPTQGAIVRLSDPALHSHV